jgi:acetyltransferase-like isoleucine patch superfamily enzyme
MASRMDRAVHLKKYMKAAAKKVGELGAFRLFALAQKQYFNLGGVGVLTIISPFAKFKGHTRKVFIGSRCSIEGGAFLECTGADARMEIGDGSVIRRGAMLITGENGRITIGSRVSVNPYSVIYGHGGLVVGDYVRIAAHVVIIPANHIYSDVNLPITFQGLDKKGIQIGNDVWLGTGVRVLDGVSIGNGSIVGAGSVVAKSLPPFTISVGVPAKVVRKRASNESA